jgi:hypothetical protein
VVPIAGSKVDVFVGGRVPRANKAKGIATTDPATGYMKIIGFEFIRFVVGASVCVCVYVCLCARMHTCACVHAYV